MRCKSLRIAIFYGGQDFVLQPLDRAEVLGIIDEEQKVVEQYENPALEMGSEAALEGILELGAEAIIVKDDTLTADEYKELKEHAKSEGKSLSFMSTSFSNLYDVLEHLEEVKRGAKDSIDKLESASESGS